VLHGTNRIVCNVMMHNEWMAHQKAGAAMKRQAAAEEDRASKQV
jgi:hypothetical protein